MPLADLLNSLIAPLSEDGAETLFEAILGGQLDQAQIAGVLSLISARGATVDEVVGAARAMRHHVTPVPVSDPASVVDTCGTGGAPKTFNVSTAAAIVAAAAGARVAKHGNRSRTGRGSAEVLECLGVDVGAPPAVQARCLDQAGVCFCFAIHHHPAMRHAAPVRRALGVPTIFNILGPLTNPAGASRQLIGVYHPSLVPLVAGALARLGATRAIVVHSDDGLDEFSIFAPALMGLVENGRVAVERVDLSLLIGHPPIGMTAHDLAAADVADSARLIREVLAGVPSPHASMVALNAGAALVVAGLADDLGQGLARACEAIADGRAWATLEHLIKVSRTR